MGKTTLRLQYLLCLHKAIIEDTPDFYETVAEMKDEHSLEIEEMLTFCCKHKPSAFIVSINAQYYERGWLSDKQEKVLIDIYNSAHDF